MIADVMLPLPVSLASLLVPFHLACQAIATCWYAIAGYDPAADARRWARARITDARQASPLPDSPGTPGTA
jgi:hypothetical protein